MPHGPQHGETGLGWAGPGARQRRGPSPAHPATPATPAPPMAPPPAASCSPTRLGSPPEWSCVRMCVSARVSCTWTSRDTSPCPRPAPPCSRPRLGTGTAAGPRPGQWWAATLPSSGSHATHCGPTPHRAGTTSQAQGRTRCLSVPDGDGLGGTARPQDRGRRRPVHTPADRRTQLRHGSGPAHSWASWDQLGASRRLTPDACTSSIECLQ